MWLSNDPKDLDFDSNSAEIFEESITHRMQTSTYRRLTDLMAQGGGDNLLDRIADLPGLFY
jgi:hypothetical protein